MTSSEAPTRVVGDGDFHCPSCHSQRRYELVIERTRKRVLGLAIGPRKDGPRRVVCSECGTRFRPDILFGEEERVAQRIGATLRQGLRGLIVRMVLEDGRVAPEEERVLRGVYEELLAQELDGEALSAEIEAASRDRRTAEEWAQDLAPLLSDDEKATVLRAALRVARADQDYDPRERELLIQIGAGLELSADTVRDILDG